MVPTLYCVRSSRNNRAKDSGSMAVDKAFFDEMEAHIPGGKVRTRFAPSPTGYMSAKS